MFKKIITLLTGFTFICVVGGVIYADACGVFLQDDEAAKQLVDRYMSFVMKNYSSGEEKISFRGIIKEGCDFWYYNDYNNKKIAENHCKGSGFEVENTEYSISYDSVEYSNKRYTIHATVTSEVYYKNYPDSVKNVSKHTFTIEQNGNSMYIVNDVTTDKGDVLLPESAKINIKDYKNLKIETNDTP